MPAAVDSALLAKVLPPQLSWRKWGTAAALGVGGLVGGDLLLHLGHGLGQGLFNLTLAGAAALWLQAKLKPSAQGLAPTTLTGWLSRCEGLLTQFEGLDAAASDGQQAPCPTAARAQQQRCEQLQHLRLNLQRPQLQLAIAGTTLPPLPCQPQLLQALSGRHELTLHWGTPLDHGASGWRWPASLASCDLVLFHLVLPLSAADLRWLEARTPGQSAWVLAQLPCPTPDLEALELDLRQQLPHTPSLELLLWDGDPTTLITSLEPLAQTLRLDALNLKQTARLQHAVDLHQQWLIELEQRRRQHWRSLLQRTQWLVAAGVLAAPGASLDLLVLTVGNGLMLKEMARLWNCPWSVDQLRCAAAELGQAALALGVIEWSNQALVNVLRLHGSSWLIGSSLQALSAAYLTRVIGHAMADTLALSAGLNEPNLALIKAQAPQLISAAAEAEKLDWSAFLEQARGWLSQQQQPPAQLTTATS